MLIIGDYANKKYTNDFTNKTLEIVYEKTERDFIKNKLKLPTDPIYKKDGLEYYYTDKLVKLYGVDDSIAFNKIYKSEMGLEFNTRYASFILNYGLYKSKIRFRSNNIREWEENLLKYLTYKEKAKSLLNRAKYMDVTYTSNLLVYYSTLQECTVLTSYRYDTKLIYDRIELYDLLSDDLNSNFLKISNEGKRNSLKAAEWNKLGYDERLGAVMECLYVDNACEYLIPQIEETGKEPKDAFIYFTNCIMNLMTSPDYTDWFKLFIENNYLKIINTYKDEYVTNLMQLIRQKVLRKL